jgi:hypothetical protein
VIRLADHIDAVPRTDSVIERPQGCPDAQNFFDLVSDTNTHAARTRTGTHEASQDRLL